MAEAGRDLTSALFGMDASSLTPAFQQKLGDVAQRLGTNPDDLLAVMRFETGGTLNPGARNRAGSGATGLIQFMPDTAKNLGTTTDALAQMTPESQLEYVEKYLTPHKGKLGTLKDTYMAVLSPQAIGKPEWYPLFTRGTKAYEQNAGLDVDKKGHVTVGDAVGSVLRFAGRALSPSRADAATPGGRDLTTTMEPARGGSGRDLTDMLFGAPAVGTPTEAPASQPTPGTAPQAAPPPTTPPGASQGPSGARLSLGDPTEAASEAEAAATVARLRASQTGAAGLQPPPADLSALAVGGGPSQQAPTVTDPAALLAGGKGAPSDEQRVLAEARARQQRGERQAIPLPPLPTVEQETLQEGITKPSTMIPLLMPGAGARTGMRILPEAWRWVGRIGGEALTQTAGELSGRAIETGQAPNWKEIATTTAWNLAPQAGEELLRAVPRAVLRSGQGARTILSDVAAQESKGLGRRVFHPQDEQVLSKMFEDVKASGVKLDIDPVTDLFTSLTPTQRQVLLRDVKTISSPMAAALQRTGTPGAPRLTGWDIGDLQTMRSELIKRGHAVRTPERQDLINEMRMAVDDAISNGMAVGSTAAGGNPEMLKAAQAGWRRLKQSDDLQALVTKHTNYSPNLQYQDLNLAALRKSLDGTNPLGRKVAASLGETETAALQQELTTLAKRYPFVKVPNSIMNIGGKVGLPGAAYLAITGNLPGAAVAASSAVMALALQSPRAMSVFRSAIVNGKGRLSSNDIAAIVNAARQVSDVEEPASGTPQ